MTQYETEKANTAFEEKYGPLYSQMLSKEQELVNLVVAGGGRFLSKKETISEMSKFMKDIFLSTFEHEEESGLEYNLSGYIQILDMKIGEIKKNLQAIQDEEDLKKKAEIEAAVNQFASDIAAQQTKEADTQKKLVEVQIEVNYFINTYNDYAYKYQNICNKNPSYEDACLVLSSQYNMDKISLERQAVSISQQEPTTEGEKQQLEVDKLKNKIEKKASKFAYEVVLKEVDKQHHMQKYIQALVHDQCRKSVAQEYDDSDRINELSELRDQEGNLRKIAALPQTIIDQFDKLTAFLYKLVVGFNPSLPGPKKIDPEGYQFPDMETLKAQIKSLLPPIFDAFSSLKIPLPPVLQPIINLIQLPAKGKGVPPNLSKEMLEKIKKMKDNFKIPVEWKDSAIVLYNTIMTLMAVMPLLLIQLIFNMIDVIIQLIKKLGISSMPYPLSLVPDCIKLMPKILQIEYILPPTMKEIVDDMMKELAAKMTAFGIGNVASITNMKQPEVGEPNLECPEALRAQYESFYAAQLSARMEKQQAEAEELKKKIKEHKASPGQALKELAESTANSVKSIAGDDPQFNPRAYNLNQEVIKKIRMQYDKSVQLLSDPTQTVDDNKPPALTIDQSIMGEGQKMMA